MEEDNFSRTIPGPLANFRRRPGLAEILSYK
jgi:hypothetical protein